MQKIRMMFVPVLLLAGVFMLARWQVAVPAMAHFPFIWDIVLGFLLGAGLCLLPELCGLQRKQNQLASLYWACAFVGFMLMMYQYASMSAGIHLDALSFLEATDGRMRLMEGAVVGYCTAAAMRGR